MSNIAHLRCFYSHIVETAVVMFTFVLCVVLIGGLLCYGQYFFGRFQLVTKCGRFGVGDLDCEEIHQSSTQGETLSEVRLVLPHHAEYALLASIGVRDDQDKLGHFCKFSKHLRAAHKLAVCQVTPDDVHPVCVVFGAVVRFCCRLLSYLIRNVS